MAHCRQLPRRFHGFKIVYEKLPSNYGGLNCLAARDLKIPYPHKCSVIVIDRNQSCRAIRDTIKHEVIEINIMKKTKLSYRRAHKLTTEIEKATK